MPVSHPVPVSCRSRCRCPSGCWRSACAGVPLSPGVLVSYCAGPPSPSPSLPPRVLRDHSVCRATAAPSPAWTSAATASTWRHALRTARCGCGAPGIWRGGSTAACAPTWSWTTPSSFASALTHGTAGPCTGTEMSCRAASLTAELWWDQWCCSGMGVGSISH